MDKNVAKRNWSEDITFILAPFEGRHKDAQKQMIDYGICTGTNRLRAVRDPSTNLWKLTMDHGTIPPPLRQKFTGWSAIHKAVVDYMTRRNIQVLGVKD